MKNKIILFFLIFLITAHSNLGKASQNISSERKERFILERISKPTGWEDANFKMAENAFRKSCDKFFNLPNSFDIKWPAGKLSDWLSVCKKRSSFSKRFFEKNFNFYKVYDQNNNDIGLFTGYFEPELEGSFTKTDIFKYPIYQKPKKKNLKKSTRAEINEGILSNRNLELLYVKDKINLFMLHVQGSGKARMPDGDLIKIGFSDSNERKYTSIGKYMIEQGYLKKENISLKTIKKWLRQNPEKADDVMNQNKRYIFFNITSEDLSEDVGPIGAQGVNLTPFHSLAVDKEYIAYGTPVFVDTKLHNGESFRELLVAQDTGSAIKGAIRGDIFFGSGKKAEDLAGNQNAKGIYYILLPKSIDP